MHHQASSRIEEGRFLTVNGVDQWITIRGEDRRNPPLLILPGPGGAGLCGMAPFFAPWERAFTLVQWDQPRAGVTRERHGGSTPGPFTIARLARDGLAVSDWVSRQLGGLRLGLVGLSAGTIVGLHMIRSRPELFSAYIATGQIAHWARQDALSYRMVLGQARQRGDSSAVAELEGIGAPPYPDTATDAIKAKYSVAHTPAEGAAWAALPASVRDSVTDPPADARFIPPGARPGKDAYAAAQAAYDALRTEIVSFDAERLELDFPLPMIFLQGELDTFTVSAEVERYASRVRAPHKRYVPIAGAGHSPWIMRDRYLDLLQEHARPILAAGGVAPSLTPNC